MILTLEQMEAHSKEDIALLASDEKYIKLYTENINDICFFNHENSPNFNCQTKYNVFIGGRSKCCVIEEKLIFYTDEKLSQQQTFPFKFIHSTNKTNICLFGSLQRYLNAVDKSKSFIDQLKVLSNSKAYTWVLKYTSQDSGIFIFGDIINNDNIIFDDNIKNIESNFESLYTSNVLTSRIFWKFKTDKLIFGDKIIGKDFTLTIVTDIPFIVIKKDIFNLIKENFFNQYIEEKICNLITVEYKLSCIYCYKNKFLEKTKNLKSIPSLVFQLKKYNLNITFTSNDLFRNEGNDIYFMITYNSFQDDDCILGSILLKKYPSIFDLDSKQIKIMKIQTEEKSSENNIVKIALIIILCVILSGLIFGFIGLKYGKKIYKPRKKNANELDDNYDYSSHNDINFDKKNGLFINGENKNIFLNDKEISMEMTKK